MDGVVVWVHRWCEVWSSKILGSSGVTFLAPFKLKLFMEGDFNNYVI